MTYTGQQLSAIEHEDNILLTACPGSGKTRTLIAKLAREVEGLRGLPKSVACITYTNSAVQEIVQRVSERLSPGDERHFLVSTIHSFCLTEILRPYGWKLAGFQGALQILTRDKPEFETIVEYAGSCINKPDWNIRDYEAFESLSLDSAGNIIGLALQNEAVFRAAPHFWRRCEELGYIDFCNIIYKSFILLRDFPEIARTLSARYPWFLVDEFQDTTELQIEILKILYSQSRSKFFVVGDINQSIFGFAGANPDLIAPFGRTINARMDLSLSGNFRSNPQVVEHAERLFARSPPMEAVGSLSACPVQPELITGKTTFQAITEDFLPKLHALGIPLGEATILAKEWRPLIQLSRNLRDYGVPVVGPGARPYRRSRLFASLAEQLCGAITDPQAETTKQLERAIFHTIQDCTTNARPDVFTFQGRLALVRLLKEAKRLAASGGAVQWLDSMSAVTGEILFELGYVTREQSGLFYASVQEMKFDMERQDIDLPNLRIEDLGLFSSPSKALRLSTIHYSKGREYTAVAMINLVAGSFPHYKATDIDAEKRLFYVGVTRARRLIMYVAEPNSYNNPPSIFLGTTGVRMRS